MESKKTDKMLKLKNIGLILISGLLLAVTAGCNKDKPDKSDSVDAPSLVACSPENGAQDLKGTALTIKLTFDRNVKSPSSKHSLVTIDNGASIDRIFAYDRDVTVEVSGLQSGLSYTIAIPEGIISGFSDNPVEALTYTFSMKAAEKDYDLNPSASLTNPDATPAAKALYSMLLENYGSKTFSGAMGGTAWETAYSDCVASAAGKYPAIVGFDYLFLNWPAKHWDGCPDYGDISPVKSAWEKGSIIQIGWHWTVPSKAGETDLNNYSYDTQQFSVDKALTEGTWQHDLIESQIAKLAGYMRLLQDAGIPVLFRPLHEAAGDYTWGAWFWWGYDGADACVRLWKHLRDELQNTYALNNLIWVWTVQTKTGGVVSSESLDTAREWYPGDDWVDIAGADLYEDKGTTQSAAFKFVNNSVMGRKMVVLSEFGNLLDIDGAYSENAPWGYMMNWCNFENGTPVLYCRDKDGNYTWNNTAEDWRKALSGSHILNRDDIK